MKLSGPWIVLLQLRYRRVVFIRDARQRLAALHLVLRRALLLRDRVLASRKFGRALCRTSRTLRVASRCPFRLRRRRLVDPQQASCFYRVSTQMIPPSHLVRAHAEIIGNRALFLTERIPPSTYVVHADGYAPLTPEQ